MNKKESHLRSWPTHHLLQHPRIQHELFVLKVPTTLPTELSFLYQLRGYFAGINLTEMLYVSTFK